MKVITAPEIYIPKEDDITCFLAGGITGCDDWQSRVIRYLRKMPVNLNRLIIFNPRRKDFPIDDPNAAEKQIKWEFDMLEKCNIFSIYFCASDSDQPICMYELGRNLVRMKNRYRHGKLNWESRIIISVEEGYKRLNDVVIQTKYATKGRILVNNIASPLSHAVDIHTHYNDLFGGELY